MLNILLNIKVIFLNKCFNPQEAFGEKKKLYQNTRKDYLA